MAINKPPLKKVNILELIFFRYFRTVTNFEMPRADSEYPVEIFIKDPFRKSLSFKTPWIGRMYAYAHITKNMKELLKINDVDFENIRVHLYDWDKEFVLSIEEPKKARELQFSCDRNEVRVLLEWCVRVPEQRYRNDMED
ncbi:MAG: hypothetical protein J6Y28_01580 [Acholeplasmatales bacterium]|nr:hypothetical protein [Acholeplasmatales bacterium]